LSSTRRLQLTAVVDGEARRDPSVTVWDAPRDVFARASIEFRTFTWEDE
jgi:hypothetical protein